MKHVQYGQKSRGMNNLQVQADVCCLRRTPLCSIGGLFGDMYLGVHELTVVEKIWAIIIEVVAVVSELIDADSDELTIQIIENDKRLSALREYAQTA